MDQRDASVSLAARRRQQIEKLDKKLRDIAAEGSERPIPETMKDAARRLARELKDKEPAPPKDRSRR